MRRSTPPGRRCRRRSRSPGPRIRMSGHDPGRVACARCMRDVADHGGLEKAGPDDLPVVDHRRQRLVQMHLEDLVHDRAAVFTHRRSARDDEKHSAAKSRPTSSRSSRRAASVGVSRQLQATAGKAEPAPVGLAHTEQPTIVPDGDVGTVPASFPARRQYKLRARVAQPVDRSPERVDERLASTSLLWNRNNDPRRRSASGAGPW